MRAKHHRDEERRQYETLDEKWAKHINEKFEKSEGGRLWRGVDVRDFEVREDWFPLPPTDTLTSPPSATGINHSGCIVAGS